MKNNQKHRVALLLVVLMTIHPAMVFAKGTKSFKAVRSYENGFSDVKQSDWFYHSVKKAYMASLISGRTSTSFEPKSNIDLCEVITIACKIHSIYNDKELVDTKQMDKWYDTYIQYAVKNGIIKGYDFEGRYDRPATRGETAYILHNSVPKSEFKLKNDRPIPDVSTATRYHNEIYRLFRSGVIEGKDIAGAFRPNEPIARMEVAVIAVKVLYEDERLSPLPKNKPSEDEKEETKIKQEALVYIVEEKSSDNERSLLREEIIVPVEESEVIFSDAQSE
ncbi:MAG: S-layer homology domain-containing protein [Filifactor alocis]|nr:S-layer homology domain-containing protein [Filifactor alocis]